MKTSTLITSDRLQVIRYLANLAKDIPGQVMEVGVFRGGSLALIAQTLPHKTVYGFDTFEGLPASNHSESEIHQPSEFACCMEEVEANLRGDDIINFSLHKGIFPMRCASLFSDNISFAHIDVDFGKSITDCLDWLHDRLSPRGIIVIDDYKWPNCPNAEGAVHSFLKEHPFQYEFYSPVPIQCWLRKC